MKPYIYLFHALVLVLGFKRTLSNNPPTLTTQNNYFVVSEDTAVGTIIHSISATDDDSNTLTFQTDSIETSDKVKLLDPTNNGGQWTCSIELKTNLDRDNGKSTYSLHFSVFDGHTRVPVKLRMVVTDVNDNPPSFTGLPYQTTVNEDQTVGTTIYKFEATDLDDGNGGVPQYHMEASVQADEIAFNETFKLHPDSGNVVLNKPLDYEKRSFYHFKVSVKDKGNPPCPGPQCKCKSNSNTGNTDYCNGTVVNFFITIKDVEDTPPVFESIPYVGSVSENKPVNFSIMKVKARDGDRGVETPSDITYSLHAHNDDTIPFNITKDGVIKISEKLDADDEDLRKRGGLYLFNVTATEEGNSNENNKSTTLVSITVLDANDNCPNFSSHHFDAKVLENTPKGVPLTMTSTIEVTDKDQGLNSRFKIFVQTQDGNPDMRFSTIPGEDTTLRGSSSVTITVNDTTILDFEKIHNITFQLIAKEVLGDDVRFCNLSIEATVTVHIQDANDNSPKFDDQRTTFDVPENASTGDLIHTFHANDLDNGDFGDVVFSLEDQNSKFQISDDGILSVNSSLDRETRNSYFIVITANDNPKAPVSQQRKSQLQVTIHVTDVNDNEPEWQQALKVFSVAETDKNGSIITVLRATDRDIGRNGKLEFSIEPNTNGSSFFGIKSNKNDEAELYIAKDLVGNPGTFVLNVIAKDNGTEQLSNSLQIEVIVADVNLDPPIFVQPNVTNSLNVTNTAEINVMEEIPVGTVLYYLKAIDEGKGPNDGVTYRIVPSADGDSSRFRVNSANGTLTSASQLNHEEKEIYEIQVTAEDHGLPSSLSTTITLRILVSDINDNEPKFISTARKQVMEVVESKPGAFVGTVNKAEDADSIDIICYQLCEKPNPKVPLQLDPDSGNLFLVGVLDREAFDEFDLKVMASSNCSVNNSRNCEGANPDSLMDIHVKVLDVNDNRPKFKSKEFSTSINYDTGIKTNVIDLKNQATDADISPNNIFYFHLVDFSCKNMNNEGCRKPIVVLKDGSVLTNVLFHGDLVGGYIELEIEVYEEIENTQKKNDTVQVKIFIVGKENRVRLVFSKLPNEVNSIKESLRRKLSDELNLNVTFGTIRTHTKADGSTDNKKTDAYIYAREENSEQFISASALQGKLDGSREARSLLIENGVQEALIEKSEKEDDEDKQLKRLLFIVVPVFSILVIALLLVLIKTVRMYRRRLKAATTLAYASPKQQEMYEHPGTNKYYTAENPLFGKEIKAPELEDDKDSTNSLDLNAVDQKSSPNAYNHVSPEEEQEVVLQIMDPGHSSPQHNRYNQNSRLAKVLEEYDSSLNQTSKPPPPYMNGVRHDKTWQNKSYAIPGLGQDVPEAVTRFSDGGLSNGPNIANGIKEISTPHGNLEYTEI